MRTLQQIMREYMAREQIGVNELGRRLGIGGGHVVYLLNTPTAVPRPALATRLDALMTPSTGEVVQAVREMMRKREQESEIKREIVQMVARGEITWSDVRDAISRGQR